MQQPTDRSHQPTDLSQQQADRRTHLYISGATPALIWLPDFWASPSPRLPLILRYCGGARWAES